MQVSSSEGPSPLMNRKVCGRPFCPRDSPPSVQRLALHGAGLFASVVLCFRVRIASRCCTRSLLMGVCRKGREEGLLGFELLEDKAGHSSELKDGTASACPTCR